MSNLLLNLDELNVRHEKSEENRTKLFDEILKRCHNKVKKYNTEFKKTDCLFEPPVFIIGKPPYNYIELVDYIIRSLRSNGLRTEWLQSKKAIYISWKKDDVDIEQYQSRFTNASNASNASGSVHDTSQNFSIMSVKQSEVPKSNRKKKTDNKPIQQHVAKLEYLPGVVDYVPINIKALR